MPKFDDKFYTDLFNNWAKIHFIKPNSVEEIIGQIIWNNSLVKIDGKSINFKHWQSKGIMFFKDLLDDNGCIITKEALTQKYGINPKPLEYEGLKHALPSEWKKKTHNNNAIRDMHVFLKCWIGKNQLNKQLCEINSKDIYNILLEDISERLSSEKKGMKKLI